MKLRPAQQTAVDFAISNVGGRPVALATPTAGGKTLISKTIADNLPGRTAIITYSNALVGQFLKDFPMPCLIGSENFRTKAEYNEAKYKSSKANCVLFNPASFVLAKRDESFAPFDNVILDEADACMSLLKILTPKTFSWHPHLPLTLENILKVIESSEHPEFADSLLRFQERYWWEVEVRRVKKGLIHSLKIHEVILGKSFCKSTFGDRVIAMSGTLFPSYCQELFGSTQYAYKEIESPIPVENRYVYGFTRDQGWKFPTSYEDMSSLLDAVLNKYTERPAVVHITYNDSREMQALDDKIKGYLTKDDKMVALESIRGTDEVMLSPGAVEGINLIDDAARLNIILRGQYANLGSDYVQKRLSLPGGQSWYIQNTLRNTIQAAGRTTRVPTDFSKIVIADVRLTRLIKENMDLLPNYFKESLRF